MDGCMSTEDKGPSWGARLFYSYGHNGIYRAVKFKFIIFISLYKNMKIYKQVYNKNR